MKKMVLFCLILSFAFPLYAQQPLVDSTESQKVAQWVKDLPPVSGEANHFSVIGGWHFMNLGEPNLQYIRQNGVEAFYADANQLAQGQQAIRNWGNQFLPLLAEGGITFLRDVQNVPWGMIEIAPDQYNFTILDEMVMTASNLGLNYVGTVAPFAAWDLAGLPPSTDEMCLRLMNQDFFYLAQGGILNRLQDMDAYLEFLGQVVERYDGDGVEDAGGVIRYWQIHNEPEGNNCGNYQADPEAYVELMRRSYETVKVACPDCQVVNGGAGIPVWRPEMPGSDFWQRFSELGGAQYVDVIAVHYNEGKHSQASEADLSAQIQGLRTALGMEKPVWLTEFGVLVQMQNQGEGGFNHLPEAEAGAWFMRFYTVGLANGVTRFYSDMMGFLQPPTHEILLPYYVNKLLESQLGGFTSAEKLADGQYKFMVNDRPVYVIWSGVPAEITGQVKVIDMYGNEQTLDAGAVQPSEANPLIITTI